MNDKPTLIYIGVIVIMSVLALSSTLAVVLFQPYQDNVPIISQIFLFSATITASVLTFLKAEQAIKQTKETHSLVNSRMTQFMETLVKSSAQQSTIAKAEGVQEGRQEQRNDQQKSDIQFIEKK